MRLWEVANACFDSLPQANESLVIRKRESEEMKQRAKLEGNSQIRKRNLVALPKGQIHGKGPLVIT